MIQASVIEWIIFFGLLFLFFIGGGIVGVAKLYRYRWPFFWTAVADTGGKGYGTASSGRCRLVTIGEGGEQVFYLNKINKFKVHDGRRIGPNKLLWTIGKDGYWYDSEFGDFDRVLKQLKLMPVRRDVRLTHSAIRKNIKDRFESKDFMQTYGLYIAFGLIFLAIIGLGISQYMSASKMNEATATNLEVAKTNKEVMEATKQILGIVDNMKTGGSGIVQVTPPTG